MQRYLRRILVIVAVILFGLILLVTAGAEFYTDWLWFEAQGYRSVFLTVLLSQWAIRLILLALVAVFVYVNLRLARRSLERGLFHLQDQIPFPVSSKWISWLFAIASGAVGFVFSSTVVPYWQTILRFIHGTPFGEVDPLFSKDIGFFIFQLPFFEIAYNFLMTVLVFTLLVVGVIYFIGHSFRIEGLKLLLEGRAKLHLTMLLIGIFLLKAIGYRMNLYQIVYSPTGVVFGAGYTDVYANGLGLRILTVVAVIAAAGLAVNLFYRGTYLIVGSIVALLIVSFLAGGIAPSLVQNLVVAPNELTKERPFIENNIKLTLQAYGLGDITERPFPVSDQLTLADLEANSSTVKNIRLWDWRPLRQTYSQLQEIRSYYSFADVDVDRYVMNGEYRQVMLSARELPSSKLPSQSWVNRHLQYTHGYGLVMSPVNQVTPEGLPVLFIRDLPPTGPTDLSITRPEIYYGEQLDDYVVVNTGLKEFDYPSGDENVYTDYAGGGGVRLGSILTQTAFAVRTGALKLLLSTAISSESRIMIYRNIKDRVRRIAPFLRYDQDPYLVVSDGRLFWIIDAYTTADTYPYSQPVRGWGNYVRNSVKVVVDAYNGDVTYYISDETDPLIKTYRKIFPGLFQPLAEMPEDLVRHIRYPEEFFLIQSGIYSVYHMTDPVVFYNREDVWEIPTESVAGRETRVDPYYMIMRLPGEERAEYVLMLPFTPVGRDNMIAWLAVRNDGDSYGQLVIYKFPKQKIVMGPAQIEARINQDASISQLLTLWGQRGSSVMRGNLLVIPIADSIIYVEPLYLRSEQSELPELKRVVAAFQDKIAIGVTLDEALQRLFSAEAGPAPPGPARQVEIVGSLDDLVSRAAQLFRESKERLAEGDFAGYGRVLDELEGVLESLQEMTGDGQQ